MKSLHALIDAYEPSTALAAEPTTPPADWYSNAELMSLEAQSIFARHWHPVARAEQLAEVGRYVTAHIAGEPVVLVRSDQGLQAFSNVCRHHAAEIMTQPFGCAQRLQCPYHGWTYDLQGRLHSAPQFDQNAGFNASSISLPALAVDTFGHWVWVRLEPEGNSLADSLGNFGPLLEALPLGQLHWLERRSYDMDCNWKVFVENYLDGGYHIPFIHRGLSSVLDNGQYRIENGDDYCLQVCPMTRSDSKEGSVRQGDTAWYYWRYPNWMINVYDGVMDTNWVLPLGPERCRVVCDFWYADISDAARERNEESLRVADAVQQEDIAICESVQRGLRSRHYQRGYLSQKRETGEQLFHQLLYADYQAGLD